MNACSCRLGLACKAFWRGLDSRSAYWAKVCIELPKRDRRPSLQYLKQGLGSSVHSVEIIINEDQAGLAEVQALDVLHHLSHCQLQSLQLSSICSSGICYIYIYPPERTSSAHVLDQASPPGLQGRVW